MTFGNQIGLWSLYKLAFDYKVTTQNLIVHLTHTFVVLFKCLDIVDRYFLEQQPPVIAPVSVLRNITFIIDFTYRAS